ncbi:NAD(P)-dependent alcohol dehydrogenase [Methanococcoides orientis]|uniref:NAD(P)-dependent alcohol dehydrogenase n=1 Tax=Methanococcoides orientis TaxID=2822137 RepID=UPI001E43DACE|nr:NAD(P)-dependent alcohol dehydrogenase [Methanococcoides orientis]UGV41372.1 NAD(P)-dependent alcohol dehydrogenase [Methanococcoides orientis]
MKAIVAAKYGSLDVLELKEVAKPIPKDNEVLVKIHAAAVTISDIMMLRGSPVITRFFTGLLRPRMAIQGSEFAGEVEAVGKDVKRFKEGDKVFGTNGSNLGCYAELVCIPEEGFLDIMPDNMSYEEAAPVCGALAAWNFLKDKANVQSGQKVLINGASGSMGTAAIQIARYFGAEVTGVCSTTNLELVKSLGADKVIDHTKEDFTKSGETYDIIFDAESKTSFSRSKGSLTQKGIYLKTFPGIAILLQMLWTSKIGSKKAKFSATGLLPVPERLIFLKDLKELIEAGILKSVIDRSYPLEQIVEAYKYVETEEEVGNIVITVGYSNNI